MKKKLVSALLCATMAASLLAGCGSGNTSDTGSSDKKGDAKTEVTNDGKTLNIYCWNEEFQSRLTAVSQTTILIIRRWMRHMVKSEISM